MIDDPYLIVLQHTDGSWTLHDATKINPLPKAVASGAIELLAQDGKLENDYCVHVLAITEGNRLSATEGAHIAKSASADAFLHKVGLET